MLFFFCLPKSVSSLLVSLSITGTVCTSFLCEHVKFPLAAQAVFVVLGRADFIFFFLCSLLLFLFTCCCCCSCCCWSISPLRTIWCAIFRSEVSYFRIKNWNSLFSNFDCVGYLQSVMDFPPQYPLLRLELLPLRLDFELALERRKKLRKLQEHM